MKRGYSDCLWSFFRSVSSVWASALSTLLCLHTYLPWVSATWQDYYICSRLAGFWHSMHMGSSVNPQVLRLFGVGNTSYTDRNRNWSWKDVYFHISLHVNSVCFVSHPVQFPWVSISTELSVLFVVVFPSWLPFFFLGLMLLSILLLIQCSVLVFLYWWFQQFLYDGALILLLTQHRLLLICSLTVCRF